MRATKEGLTTIEIPPIDSVFRLPSTEGKKTANEEAHRLPPLSFSEKAKTLQTKKKTATHQVDARPLDGAARYLEQQVSGEAELLELGVRQGARRRSVSSVVAVGVVAAAAGMSLLVCRRRRFGLFIVAVAAVVGIFSPSSSDVAPAPKPRRRVAGVIHFCSPIEIALARRRALVAGARRREHWKIAVDRLIAVFPRSFFLPSLSLSDSSPPLLLFKGSAKALFSFATKRQRLVSSVY